MSVTITGGKGSTDQGNPGALATGILSRAEGVSVALGDYSHCEGHSTLATYTACHAEGDSTTASGQYSHAEGLGSTASGVAAHVEGASNIASADYSHAGGFRAVAPRAGQHSRASFSFAAPGDAQAIRLTNGGVTSNATPRVLTSDGGPTPNLSGAGTNVLTLPVNRAHRFRATAVARRSDVSGDAAGWEFSGLIARGTTGSSAAFDGTVFATAWSTGAGSAPWDMTFTIDTSDPTINCLKITVTGEAGKTIRWVAHIDTTEVG